MIATAYFSSWFQTMGTSQLAQNQRSAFSVQVHPLRPQCVLGAGSVPTPACSQANCFGSVMKISQPSFSLN